MPPNSTNTPGTPSNLVEEPQGESSSLVRRRGRGPSKQTSLEPPPNTKWQRKYDFVEGEKNVVCDDMVIEAMKPLVQKYLKNWRAYLKKNCFEKVAEEDLSGSPDTRVTDEEWDNIVKYWKNEDNVKVAQMNKQNRSHAQATHTLGTRSIARHYNDERQKKGTNFDILESYLSAHQCKKGGYPNTHTQLKCAEVVEKFHGIEGVDPTDPRALSSVLDKVYKGHHGGYERGLGTGWSRRKHSVGATSSRNENNQLSAQLEEALVVISQLKESNQEKSAHIIQMEKQMQVFTEFMEASNRNMASSSQDFTDSDVGETQPMPPS
ncbi:hypothetical protein H6P81_010295 [Aristolochia fimbriata]|uniref:Transposase, Ptta/En/Spm, plant n=1 Tax=Aristolochia fimbriata TaxID=158543 RepID=A0AAV7ENC3_ARIFI|nr:hypothetical protein H6P81_010295 [Aristolochia fimbriata]